MADFPAMADVGLDAELVLAIDQALSDIDRLEQAVSAATTDIPVSLDISGIDAALTAITPEIPVAADTTDAEAAIGSLADAPPVDVPVAADTTTAVSDIAALESSVPAIDIPVEADTTAANEQIADLGSTASETTSATVDLSGSVEHLGAVTGIAEGSARELVGAVGELGGESGVAAAGGVLALSTSVGAFFEEGLNAVSAGQRFDLVLGDMGNKIKEINVNGLNTSVEDLGITFGSTAADMENVNSKLFQNAINAGVSKDKAVEFAQQIETLSARAISLNPQLGTLADVSSNLGDKLARGGRFAANYGIQLTAAEISTRALADTGKDTAADLTIVEKSIAGAELASEKYGATLAGTVAEGSKNAAVQAESLKASFKEAIEQIGVPLVAPILDLIREAEPDAITIAKSLGELGHDVLPAVSGALAVIGPPLQVVGDIIHEIPGPIVSGTVAFFGMRAAMEAVATAAIADEAALTVLATAIPWLAAITAGFVVINGLLADTPAYTDEVTQAIDTASKGFDDLTVSVKDTTAAEVEAASNTGDFAQHLNDANVSVENLTEALITGGDAYKMYSTEILGTAVQQGASFDQTVALDQQLSHLADTTQTAAKTSLDKAVADGKLTQAQADEAVAAAGQVAGKTNYAGALDRVQPKIAAQIKSEEDAKKASDDAAKAADDYAKALALVQGAAPGVAMTLQNVVTVTGDHTNALAGLAVALGDATLSTNEYDAVSQTLGVTTNALKGYVKDVTTEVNNFVTDATNGLPKIGDAIDRALDPANHKRPDHIIIDPAALQAELTEDYNRINGFNLNLQVLVDNGFGNLAKIAAQRGPEFAQALVQNFQNGGADATLALEERFGQINQQMTDEPGTLRTLGVDIATSLGDVGAAASKEFGDKFSLDPTVAATIDGSKVAVADKKPAFVSAVAGMSADAAEHWSAGLSPIPTETATAFSGAESAVTSSIPGIGTAAAQAGEAAHGGMKEGTDQIADTTGQSIANAGAAITGSAFWLRIVASVEGAAIGKAFDDGLAGGIEFNSQEVSTAAGQVVTDAAHEARVVAGAHSPSQLFAEIGYDLSSGLAVGLDSGLDDVKAAMHRQVAAAAPSLPAVRALIPSGGFGAGGVDRTVSVTGGSRSGPIVSIGQQVFYTPDPVMAGRENARQLRALATPSGTGKVRPR